MATQELKFRVDSFGDVQHKLDELGAELVKHSESSHYYCLLAGNDVLKLVAKAGGVELHELKEHHGKFELVKNERCDNLREGLERLRKRGFDKVGVVQMAHTDYQLDGGVVGLYTINGHLKSVILDFPGSKHAEMKRMMGLEGAEMIQVPYNKYLQERGQLELVPLEEVK